MYVCMYVCICVCVRVCVCMYVCVCVYRKEQRSVFRYMLRNLTAKEQMWIVRMILKGNIRMYVCVCVCISVYVCE